MTTTEEALRPFSEWLTDHAGGSVDDEMTAAVAEVVQAVAQHGKAGTVTLKVKVELAGSIGARSVVTTCKVTPNPPEPDGEQSIFFIGKNGSLHREDPYQQKADFGDVRKVDPETGEIRQPKES